MDADDLYGLPLDRFIPERTALAKELRAAGDRDAAADVAALRKPTVAAWAVNQLVRTQSKAFGELTAAGDSLYRAQLELMEGQGDPRSLREVQHRERVAVDALLTLARGLLSSDGDELSPAVLERVSDTLHAAALDVGAREAVSGGRLERERTHIGLGNLPDVKVSCAGRGGRPKKSATKEPPPPPATVPDKQAARELAEARRGARVAEGEARRRAEIAGRAVRAAEQRRDLAAEALAEAEQELTDARAEAAEATEAHRRAEADLKKKHR